MNGFVYRIFALSLSLSLLFAAACPIFAAEPEGIVSEDQAIFDAGNPGGSPLFEHLGGSGELFSDDAAAADESGVSALDAYEFSDTQIEAGVESLPVDGATGEDAAAVAIMSSALPSEIGADIVYTEAELSTWLMGHSEGTVTLGDNIELNTPIFFTGPVTIDTAAYGLCFNGGLLATDYVCTNPEGNPAFGSIFISGEGVDVPVVDVQSMGRMFFGDWSNYLCALNVTARGREGMGGTALRLSQSGSGRVSLRDLERDGPCLIRSFGTGAVGVELVESFSLYFFDVQVEGDNSIAVYAHADAGLAFSRFRAEGEGAQAVHGTGEIEMDACAAEPLLDGDHIALYQSNPFAWWLPFEQGGEKPPTAEDWPWNVALVNSSDVVSGLMPSVTWDLTPLDSVAYFDELGSTLITGELASSWLCDLIPESPEMIVAVRDPQKPCIDITNTGWDTRLLYFWTCDAWDVADCILWYSDDDGETWRDCTDDADILWEANCVTVPESMIDGGTLFVIEVPGFGFSNVARFAYEYGKYSGIAGGDRIGTDRISVSLSSEGPLPSDGQTELPGNIDPPGGEEPGQPSQPDTPQMPVAYMPPNPPRKNAPVQLESIENRGEPVLAAPVKSADEPELSLSDLVENENEPELLAPAENENEPEPFAPAENADEPTLSGTAVNVGESALLDSSDDDAFIPSEPSDEPAEEAIEAPIEEPMEALGGDDGDPFMAEVSGEVSRVAADSPQSVAEPLATAALVDVDIVTAHLWEEQRSTTPSLLPLQEEMLADVSQPRGVETLPEVHENALPAAQPTLPEPDAGANTALVAAAAVALASIGAWFVLGRLRLIKK